MTEFNVTGLNLEHVINADGTAVQPADLVGKIIGFYFSAHWCGPCRGFTPKLAEKYKEIVAAGHPFEIIFISADETEDEALDYFKEMPWKMLAFHDREGEEALSKQFEVSGIPTLVLVDEKGEVLTTRGQECAMEAPFVNWRTFEAEKQAEEEREARELAALRQNFDLFSFLAQCRVLNSAGQSLPAEHFQDKVLGLYFSAHWCPPCRGFTPQLAEKYKALLAEGKKFEIVFVSSDRDAASAQEYFAEMPWVMLDFADRQRKKQLGELFEVSGIPTLVLVDAAGTITTDGREAIMTYAFDNLRDFEADKKAAREQLDAEMASFPEEVTIAEHEHPLQKLPTIYGGGYGCDICGEGGEGWVYHCGECGWDAHPKCACKDRA